jgi:hypothetical protein
MMLYWSGNEGVDTFKFGILSRDSCENQFLYSIIHALHCPFFIGSVTPTTALIKGYFPKIK